MAPVHRMEPTIRSFQYVLFFLFLGFIWCGLGGYALNDQRRVVGTTLVGLGIVCMATAWWLNWSL